jgi:hypothetical protein
LSVLTKSEGTPLKIGEGQGVRLRRASRRTDGQRRASI